MALTFILFTQSAFGQRVCLVGSAADMSGLSADEQNAYQWAMDNYGADAAYISFSDISMDGLPASCEVVWYHLQAVTDIPMDASDAAGAIEGHLNAGGGLFLSGFGTKYITNVNATAIGPNETINNPNATSDAAWGFRQTPGQEGHPIFAGLSDSMWPNPDWGGIRTVAEGTETQETIAWWTGASFPGTQLASLPWLPAGEPLATLGVLETSGGMVAVASAPGFAWAANNLMPGEERDNLETLTSNIIDFITPPDNTKIVLMGDPADFSGLSSDEQNAYQWALDTYGDEAAYRSFADVAANGLPANTEVVWFHLQATTDISADAVNAAGVIEPFMFNGGGVFLSGFGTQLITSINATGTGPNEIINNPNATSDAAWGFRQTPGQENHPFFDGLSDSMWPNPDWGGVRTVAEGTETQETIAWWTGGSFPGTQLASLPWLPAGEPLTTLGVLDAGDGKVAVATAPGFAWAANNPMPGEERDNLEQLTENILGFINPNYTAIVDAPILLVGDAPEISGLSADEQNAYQWALDNYGSEAAYVSFSNIAANGLSSQAEVVWFHLQAMTNISADAINAAGEIETFMNAGGGVFLSGFGTQYITTLNATGVGPNEVINNPNATADAAWGFRQTPGQENHPVFDGLSESMWPNPDWGGFRTVAEGTEAQETMAWWTGGSFPGIQLASLPWLPAGEPLTTLGVMDAGDGQVAVAAAPGFAWGSNNPMPGEERDNLELLTENIIEFIRPVPPAAVTIALMGSAPDVAGLSIDEANAYTFAIDQFAGAAQYYQWGAVLPNTIQVIWYHLQSQENIPVDAVANAAAVGDFVNFGGGLFLSGQAVKFITETGATTVGPNEVIYNTGATSDGAWGFRQTPGQEMHPVFDGLPESAWDNPDWGGFQTIGPDLMTNENINWYTGGSYPGIQLASLPWLAAGADLATVGELAYGQGAVIHASAPGYSWEIIGGVNEPDPQANLELFTENVLNYLFDPQPAPRILVSVVGNPDNIIEEGQEDGAIINVALESSTYEDPIDPANWSAMPLPPNVTVGAIDRIDDNNVQITLSGTADDYDDDILDFTVIVPASDLVGLTNDLSSTGDVIFDAIFEIEPTSTRVALLGTEENMADLDGDEIEAYMWALETFGDDAAYIWVQDMVLDPTILDDYDVAWWHYDQFIDLPLLFDNENTEDVLKAYLDDCNGILLTGAATQYVTNLEMTASDKGPNEVRKADPPFTNPDPWGFLSPVPDHPIFEGLNNPFFGLFTDGLREDVIAWWNLVPDFEPRPPEERFDGIHLTSTEWDANFNLIVSSAEFQGGEGNGNVICVGAGAYDWFIEDGENTLRPNLELWTFNMLNYLADCTTSTQEVISEDLKVNAHPNPFTDEVGIYFTLVEGSNVSIDIYDMQGRYITNILKNERLTSGVYGYPWKAENQTAGMYMYKVTAGNKVGFGKIVLK